MRDLIWTVAIVLLIGVAVSAQEKTPGITGKGLKLGLGFANISTDYQELNDFLDSRSGASCGAFVTYSFNRRWAVQPELLYVSKGAQKDLFFVSAEWKINYLEVPVLAKFNIVPDAQLQPSLYAGPALSILLGSKFRISDTEYDVADGMKTMDLGFVFGGGLDYRHVTFDIRYTLGLLNTVDAARINSLTEAQPGDSYYLEGNPSIKNRSLSFMIGAKF